MRVARLLAKAGVHVPRVIAEDLEQGFLLLSDLGTTSYLQALKNDTADELFRDAIDALLRWQLASRPGALPPYDEALLTREMKLFPEWYLQRHLGLTLNPAQLQALDVVFALILNNNLVQPAVYVHRDYMPRNLMVCESNPGVLDFQDAVYGPITYDVASLFRDAFVSWGCSATSKCWASSRGCIIATASAAISKTRRASSVTCAPSPSAISRCAPCSRCSMRSRTNRKPAPATPFESDHTRSGAR